MRMDAILQPSAPLRGTLAVPPDKSICHRAVLIAALAKGETAIHPWPGAEDCQRTLEVVRALGVSAKPSGQSVTIAGCALEGLRAPRGDLFCGESGTTLRLAVGLLAGQPFTARLTAGPSLSLRPMRRIIEPLAQMGAVIEGTAVEDGAECFPPLTVQGRRPLRAIRYELPVASAQVKSAILLAGLFASGRTTVIERQRTRDHTERMLRHYGLGVRAEGQGIALDPGLPVSPGTLELPGDFSSAAFFLVAAACIPGSRVEVEGVGLNPTRIALLGVLERMGAAVTVSVERDSWEPCGTVAIEARPLRALSLEPGEVPGVIDELPVLMVAAACAEGATRLTGLGELRVKETDRVRSMVSGLRGLGARISAPAPDVVEIRGGPLTGGEVESAGDHRTAMSLAIAGLAAGKGSTVVRGVGCVSKSFPEFFQLLGRLAGSSTVKTVDKP